MDLTKSLEGLIDAREKLATRQGIDNPTFISEQMMRLSQYTASAEAHLADLEYNFEIKEAQVYKSYLLDRKLTTTAAERLAKADLAEEKAQIKRLSRLVSSAWRTIGICQSRIRHLEGEFKVGGQVT